MSDDLKARIAKWKKGQTAGISPSTVTLLNDCLARIEKLEWENKLFLDRLKELDTCHPDYGVSLETAKKRLMELEQENQHHKASYRELSALNVAGHTIEDWARLKAQLEASKKVWQRRPKLIMYTAWENEMAACFRVKEKR